MIDKEILKETIHDCFPDLENTKFSFNNNLVTSFTDQSVLPFLIYQNTIDSYHRLIALYLPENCGIRNLIPFYVMMGQYRKALNNIMHANKYRTESYKSSQKQIVFNGDICSISSVDFINRQLVFKSGRGQVINIPFFENYKVNWQRSAFDIRDKIDSFEKIDKASKSNIFTFPDAPTDDQYEGVIIFTNTSKFESLLRNVKVSKTDFRDHLNIQKVVFPSNDGDICFKRLSKSQTATKPISLLIARHDAFRAYDLILEAGNGSLGHIKTVIIDDFDDLIQQWENSDSCKEELTALNEIYFQKVRERHIKDLYLISRNSNLHIHTIFKELGITYNPWLLKPLEELAINDRLKNLTPEITLTNIDDVRFETLSDELNTLIGKWKFLAQSSFCNGEILNPISSLYEIRTKLNTFFDPKVLHHFIEDFLNNLNKLQNNWFTGGQDYSVIKETRKFLLDKISDESCFINFKLGSILDELHKDEVSGLINIVSDNSNFDDIKWLTDFIANTLPKTKARHYHKKDFFISKQDDNTQPSIIFYLTSDKKLIGATTANVLAEKQIFILNKKAYGFTESQIKKYQHLQMEAGGSSAKYELLNLAPPNSHESGTTDLIKVLYKKRETNLRVREDEASPKEMELQELVAEIVQRHYSSSSKELSDKFILFFGDGTVTEVLESRRFFVYEDDKESDDLEKILVPVSNLNSGDQVITTKRGLQVKELLERVLKKNTEFSHALEMDEKWRLLISNHIKRCSMDLDYFCKKLLQNGFRIGAASVKNWIDGETRRPDNFKGLLLALNGLGIINRDEITAFDRCNSELKSIQIKFVRTAIRRLIAHLHGINFEEDEVFNDSMLSDFINHIEIKRISTIYKI